MPIYDCGAPDCDECRTAFGPDRTKAIASYNARERFYRDIPAGVYWSREAGNFYDTQTNRGMGLAFYEEWQDVKDRFPEKPTTSPGLDLYLTKSVVPAQ